MNSGSFSTLEELQESLKKRIAGDDVDAVMSVREAFKGKLTELKIKLSKEHQTKLREEYGDDIAGLAEENARIRSQYEQLKEALQDPNCWFGPDQNIMMNIF